MEPFREEGLEYMALGVSASILDYAKFARLYLEDGKWNGSRIISSEWVGASVTTAPSVNGAPAYYNTRLGEVVNEYFAEKGVYYSRHWWGKTNPGWAGIPATSAGGRMSLRRFVKGFRIHLSCISHHPASHTEETSSGRFSFA